MLEFTVGSKIKFANPQGKLPLEGTIYKDYKTRGDGVHWVMLRTAVLKDVYTDEDRAERVEFDALPLIKNGEQVKIDGVIHDVLVLGRYSDCAVFKTPDQAKFVRL